MRDGDEWWRVNERRNRMMRGMSEEQKNGVDFGKYGNKNKDFGTSAIK